MRFSDLRTRWTAGVAKKKKEWNSRRCSKPITESTSAEVRKTPATGEPVDSSAGGASCGVTRTCDRRSGEAPSKNHTRSSGEKASWVCARAAACSEPARRPEQLRQPQFHCGKPPPAAD